MKGCQISFVFLMIMIKCMINAVPFAAQQAQKGVLTNVVLAQEKFQGEYNVPGTDKGISFSSKATPSSIEMHIASSKTDYPILTAIRSMPHSNHDVTIMSVNSTDFMIVKNQQRDAIKAGSEYDDYIIPDEAMKGRMLSMIMSAGVKNHDILNRLHKEGIAETRQSVFRALAMSDEGKLIVQTAEALGYDHNIQGTAHPSIMKFYQVARKLAEIRGKENAEIGEFDHERAQEQQADRDGQEPGVQCESYDTICPSEELCPYPEPKYDNPCFGLCGYSCNCWEFVCGDCCIHEYCLSHDHCCGMDYWSWACIMTPFASGMMMECEDTVECY